jgi:hypothetical protein
MFVGKALEAIQVEHLSVYPLLVYLFDLLANIRLGWRGLPGTNTLVYYENP